MRPFSLFLFLLFLGELVHAQSTVQMEKHGGVYYVPCIVNGLKLNFIFDTGASDVSISLSEAVFMLKNGYMSENDLVGTEYFRIANGEIAEGTKLNIRLLEIGGRKLTNVRASVVHSLEAPLLLGQSVLERFGHVSVNYADRTLILGTGVSLTSDGLAKSERGNKKLFDSVMSNSTKKFGNDELKCQDNIMMYRDFYKKENYDEALRGWRYAFLNCPMATKNILINGPKIIESQLDYYENIQEGKNGYLDTLYVLYDVRAALFPEDRGFALGRKGMEQYDYCVGDYTMAFNTLKEAFDLEKLETDGYVLMKLYMAAMRRLVDQQMRLEDLYDLYNRITSAINYQQGRTRDDNELKKLKQVREIVDKNYERIKRN